MSAERDVTDIVVEILKKHGEWIETSPLVKLVAKERNVSQRQAYRDIKKAWEDRKVRKIKLPDGYILNGLPNWPFSGTSVERQKESLRPHEAFVYRCFKNLEEISNEKNDGDPLRAYAYIHDLIKMLPQSYKQKLKPKLAKSDKRLSQTRGVDLYWTRVNRRKVARVLVEDLIDEISTLLHEYTPRVEESEQKR